MDNETRPLRKVVAHSGPKNGSHFDLLECGHEIERRPDPGRNSIVRERAKRRRCWGCSPEGTAAAENMDARQRARRNQEKPDASN